MKALLAVAVVAGVFCAVMFAAAGAYAVPYELSVLVRDGDVLPDGTIVNRISLPPENEGDNLALNDNGTAAFTAQTSPGEWAVFTQHGKQIISGDVLADGATVFSLNDTIRQDISISPAGTAYAYGRIEDGAKWALFSRNGVVAADGDILPDGATAVDVPADVGNVAVSPDGMPAFVIRVDPGPNPRLAVATTAGAVVTTGDTLPDGSTLERIWESGEQDVAINRSGTVAFFGRTTGSPVGPSGVMTQHGMLIEIGQNLPDGVNVWNLHVKNGCIGINDAGEVASIAMLGFHGGSTDFGFDHVRWDTAPAGNVFSRCPSLSHWSASRSGAEF